MQKEFDDSFEDEFARPAGRSIVFAFLPWEIFERLEL